jgi:hypothetical protein
MTTLYRGAPLEASLPELRDFCLDESMQQRRHANRSKSDAASG